MNEQIVNLIAALRVIRNHAETGLSDVSRRDEILQKIIRTVDSEISAVLQATAASTTKAEGR